MEIGPWNWLEVVKLLSSLLVPVVLAIFGIYVHHVTKRFENLQWRSQKLVEKRLTIYDDLAPLLNDLLCYFTYVGPWKELKPPDVIRLKRVIDKKIHLASPLFSKVFFGACMDFQNLCFETYAGWGYDALLKTQWQRRKECTSAVWKEEWAECFSTKIANPKGIRDAYHKIMEQFAVDIGVHPGFVVPPSGRVPSNIG